MLESDLDIILKKIEKNEFFKNFNENTDSYTKWVLDSDSSTSKRVLLSNDFYSDFKDYFIITSALHLTVYEIYYSDDKILDEIKDTTDEFNEYLVQHRPIEQLYWHEGYWRKDDENNKISKKEGIKAKCNDGRFIVNELVQDAFYDRYRNIVQIHPTHKFNESDNDDFSNYNWIFGKYQSSDNYTIRFYWNFLPKKEIVSEFIAYIQHNIDNARIPFTFKFLTNISEYKKRTDVAVLYFPRKNALHGFELVRDIYKRFSNRQFFCDKTPMFTKIFGNEIKGLSFGENPDDRRYTSFGSYRAIYIAMAIIDFYYKNNENLPTTKDIITFLNKSHSKKSKPPFPQTIGGIEFGHGQKGNSILDPKLLGDAPQLSNNILNTPNWTDQFHVNQFSTYDYSNEINFFKKTLEGAKSEIGIRNSRNIIPIRQLDFSNLSGETRHTKYLKTAIKIADILCKEAAFYPSNEIRKNRKTLICNWLSLQSIIKDSYAKKTGYRFQSLDETFLEGRLGVAYFLKQVHKVYHDETFYRTAYRAYQSSLVNIKTEGNCSYYSIFDLVSKGMIDGLIRKVSFFKEKQQFINEKLSNCNTQNINFDITWGESAWREDKYRRIIGKVLTSNEIINPTEYLIIDEMLTNYFDVERPFGNALGTDEFCATIKDGYACLGYFFLRLYDPITFKALPFKITYV